MNSLTVCMSFHREGLLANASINSLKIGIDRALESGLSIKVVASLDRANDATRMTVLNSGIQWDQVFEYEIGDLGGVRRDLVKKCASDYIAFHDGDDLIGSEWIEQAFDLAEKQADNRWVIHPEYVYYFSEEEYPNFGSQTIPNDVKQNFFIRHIPTTSNGFDPRVLIFNNVFTSNVMCPLDLYDEFPYIDVDVDEGFGIEDWTWNARTILGGVRHLVVEDSVHLVRVKASNSLGKLNSSRYLLPKFDFVFREQDIADSISSHSRFLIEDSSGSHI